MATEVIMPALGVAQETGKLVRWLKREGERVERGEPLMEVETDKATVEIEAPASGTLVGVAAQPGDEVPVGRPIALILAPAEESPAARPVRGPAAAAGKAAEPKPVRLASPSPAGRVPASPAARRLARERGIELAALRGSGPGGAVIARDVLAASGAARAELVPLTSMRRIVGERMAESKRSAPHFYLTVEIDMTEAERLRTKRREAGAEVVPSINDLVLWAAARTLGQFPYLNASFAGEAIRLNPEVHLGFAVALEEGLLVPVIRNANRLSLEEIARQSRELVERAHRKKLLPADCEGGTFTVSNLGAFGIESFAAIINPPQCAILAVGRVSRRVVAHGEGIAVRPMMTATLSADHRVVDGADAARFLNELKSALESPAA
jgi:pyruvate dehydrogenase E2 component (dihydrolipoamide acetyltransferase)